MARTLSPGCRGEMVKPRGALVCHVIIELLTAPLKPPALHIASGNKYCIKTPALE